MLRLLPQYLLGGLGAFFRRLRRGPRAATWAWGLEMLVAGHPHDFHLLGLVEPRGSEALLEVARFLRARLDGS